MKKISLSMLIWASIASATSPCNQSLNACLQLSAAQDAYILKLKADEQELLKKIEVQPLLPGWAWFIIGSAAGVTAYSLLHR